jgi:hypothetical protein
MSRQKVVDKTVTPQQTAMTPTTALTSGYGKADIGLFRGAWAFVDLDKAVVQPLVLAEKAHALDRLDSRNGVAVTVPNGTALNAVVTGQIEVPAGEVWYINRLAVTCPAADATGTVSHNILVSSWPKTAAGGDKPYLAANATAMGATTNYDVGAVGQLGEELRLVGGDKLTLTLTVTVAFTADKVFRLDVYGRRGKLLVS